MSETLIIGASGQVGSALTSTLTAAGHKILRATSRAATEVDQIQLNLLTGEGLDAAFSRSERVFLMAPPGLGDQHKLLGPAIAAAQRHQHKKVVLMTAMGADADPNSPMRQAELLLENSGLPYHILRPNWFMQNFNTFWLPGIQATGQILLPVGEARGSFIDARDIAAVAAVLLHDTDRPAQAWTLTGAEALNHHEVAAILSEASGKNIGYTDIPPEQMHQLLLEAGLPADYADFLLLILGAFRQGYAAAVTDHVPQLLGRAPITLADYARDYRSAWA